LKIRLLPFIIPWNAPNLLIESIINCEQDGENLHDEGKINDSVFWYNLIRRMKKGLSIYSTNQLIKGNIDFSPSYLLLFRRNNQCM